MLWWTIDLINSVLVFVSQYPSETTVDDGDDLRWPEEEIQGVICSLALFEKSIYWSKNPTPVFEKIHTEYPMF